jgi:hypothetical protein
VSVIEGIRTAGSTRCCQALEKTPLGWKTKRPKENDDMITERKEQVGTLTGLSQLPPGSRPPGAKTT